MAVHRIKINLTRHLVIALSTLLLCLSFSHLPRAWAWDSASWNPTHPTHSYLTELAIDQLNRQFPEIETYRNDLLEGANTELHELPVSGTKYGIDLNSKRIQHKGTNEGCDDIQGWWQDSLSVYKTGNKKQAYFLTGIMLHMIEDMGVPAHANKVYHQGNATEFDNFEYMSLFNWKPDFNSINHQDPNFADPWKYYIFNQEWTHADAPNYRNRNSFSKTWSFASQAEKTLLSNRQARTATVAKWALNSAVKIFTDKSQGSKPISLAGTWQSDWGPVVFNSDLTGSWNQGSGKFGQIQDGAYDPQTRRLVFHYYQSWNNMNGTATLMLSGAGNQLSGTWTQQRGSNPPGSGGSGGWTMTRNPSQ